MSFIFNCFISGKLKDWNDEQWTIAITEALLLFLFFFFFRNGTGEGDSFSDKGSQSSCRLTSSLFLLL